MTLNCGEFRATGKSYGALKSILEQKLVSQLEWDCHWDYAVPIRDEYGRIVGCNYGTQDCTASRISPWLDDFQDTLRRHTVFSDQFSPWFGLRIVHFGCAEEKRATYASADVRNHELGWTGEESDDYKCFLYGRIPSPGQCLLAKASVNVPIGQRLRMTGT